MAEEITNEAVISDPHAFDPRLDSSLPFDTKAIHDKLVWGEKNDYATLKKNTVEPTVSIMKERCLAKCPDLYDDLCAHADAFEKSIEDFQKQEATLSHHPQTWDKFILTSRKSMAKSAENYLNATIRDHDPVALRKSFKDFIRSCDSGRELFQNDTQALARKTLQYRKQVEELMQQSEKLDHLSKSYPKLFKDAEIQKDFQKIKENCHSIIMDTAEVYKNTQPAHDDHPYLSHHYMEEAEKQVKNANRAMKSCTRMMSMEDAFHPKSSDTPKIMSWDDYQKENKEIAAHTAGYLSRTTSKIKENMHNLVRGIQKSLKHSISEFRSLRGKPQSPAFITEKDAAKAMEYFRKEALSAGQSHSEFAKSWKDFAKDLDKAASKQKFIETAKTR